jgi:glycosyltransferase involved in cell wall biosynthesis
VLSSSPPFAAHVVAYTLAKTWGIPWIADVRDGYSFEPPEGYSPLRAVRRRLEQTLYAHAARVFTVTEALSDDLRTLLPARRDRIETIENGFDAALFETPTPRPASSRDDWTVLYAGSVSFGAGRNLRALMTGVDRISTQSHQTVRLQLIGIFAPSDVAPGLQHARLQLCGWQARSEVARSMQAADVLVVLTGNHKTVATTKLYEYIGAGRPILVVGRQSAAARIVSEGQFGLVTDDDPNGIAAALTQLQRERAAWEAHLQSPPVCSARARFSRETQAAQLAAHVHALLATD